MFQAHRATRVRVMKSDQTVQCDVPTHCPHLYMLYEWVFCSQDWEAANSIQWNLSPAETHWRTGKVEATIDFVNTAATNVYYCDASCSILKLVTWASDVNGEMFTRS